MKTVEFWGILAARWPAFPQSDYVNTTIAISDGISLATRRRNDNDPGQEE